MPDEYKRCVEACYLCAAACDHCATSCLDEENVEMMRECIRLDMQCANTCRLAAQFMALNSGSVQQLCQFCADICQQCAQACQQHQHQHCQQCARACQRCAEECRKIAA
ncbi:MAG: four-helix bundle copper-binding protein [Pantoea dispersa]